MQMRIKFMELSAVSMKEQNIYFIRFLSDSRDVIFDDFSTAAKV